MKPAKSAFGGRVLALLFLAFAAFSATGDQKATTTAAHPPQTQTPAAATAAADIGDTFRASSGFRFDAGDIVDVRGLFVDIANDEDDAFGAFRKRAQMRLFTALEDGISRRAEAFLSNFADIRSADIFFQSELGGRRDSFGMELIGAFTDNPGESSFGWQLRAFGGAEHLRGGNVGVFLRRVAGGALYGGNLFYDYQNIEYGDFFRYGAGLEFQTEHLSAAANYYIPTGADRRVSELEVAFSREGYDANVRVAIPGVRYVDAEAAYYSFDGKGGTHDDKGFRYGAAVSPGFGVHFKLYYDQGGGEFGGELSYSYLLGGGAVQSGGGGGGFVPDLFAPVWREHTQRIALQTVEVAPPVFAPQRYVHVADNGAVGTIGIRQLYYTAVPQVSFLHSPADLPGRVSHSPIAESPRQARQVVIYWQPSAANQEGIITVAIMGTSSFSGSVVAATFAVSVSSYADLTAAIRGLNMPAPALAHGTAMIGTVGVLSVSGGVSPYTHTGTHADVGIIGGTIVFDSTSGGKTITTIITTDDTNTPRTPPILMTLILTAVESGFVPLPVPSGVIVLTQGVPGTVGNIALPPGGGFNGNAGLTITGGALLFSAAVAGMQTLSLTITESGSGDFSAYTVTVSVQPVAALVAGFSVGSNGGVVRAAGESTPNGNIAAQFAIITVGGGYTRDGVYDFRFANDARNDFGLHNPAHVAGRGCAAALCQIRFRDPSQSAATAAATLIIDDDNEHTAPVSIFLTATAVSPIVVNQVLPASYARVTINTGYTFGRAEVMGGLNVTGGITAGHPFRFERRQDGFEYLVFAPAVPTLVTTTIRYDDTTPLTDPVFLTLTATAYAHVAVDFTREPEPGEGVGAASRFVWHGDGSDRPYPSNIFPNGDYVLATGILGTVGTFTLSGGNGNYQNVDQVAKHSRIIFDSGDAPGSFRIEVSAAATGVYSLVVAADDVNNPVTPPSTVTIFTTVRYFFPPRRASLRARFRAPATNPTGIPVVTMTHPMGGFRIPPDDGTRPFIINMRRTFQSIPGWDAGFDHNDTCTLRRYDANTGEVDMSGAGCYNPFNPPRANIQATVTEGSVEYY